MNNWKRIVLLGALAGSIWPFGEAWSFDSMLAAYSSALQSDRAYLAAEAQHRATLEKVPQARAGLLPLVTANVNRTKYDTQVDYEALQFQDIDRRFRVNGWTLSFSQPLFRMANLIQYGRAQLQAEQSHVQLQAARQDLLVRTVRGFLEWQAALRASEAAEFEKRYLEALAAQARSSRSVKLMTVPEQLDAEARFSRAAADALFAVRNQRVKAAELSRVVGVATPDRRFEFRNVTWPEVKGEVEQWIEQARNISADVRYQMLQEAIADKDVSVARAGHLPTLNLVVNKSRTFNSGSTDIIAGSTANLQNQLSLGLQMEVPIFAGGAVNSRVDEAVALRDKAREELANARDGAAINAQTHYFKAETGVAKVEAAERKVVAAESQLASAKAGAANRTRLELDVIGAEAALLAAKRDLFQARIDRLVSVLQLRQTAGELTDEDIAVWSSLVTPAATEMASGTAIGTARQ